MCRTLYYAPDGRQFNALLAYSRRIGRFQWSSQVNVNHVLNRYEIRAIPNAATGFNTPSNLNATWYQQPRSYQWTHAVRC